MSIFANFYDELREEEVLRTLLDCVEHDHGAGAGQRGHLRAPLMQLDTDRTSKELLSAIVDLTPEQAGSAACLKVLGDLVSELALSMRFQFERDAAEVSNIVTKYRKWMKTRPAPVKKGRKGTKKSAETPESDRRPGRGRKRLRSPDTQGGGSQDEIDIETMEEWMREAMEGNRRRRSRSGSRKRRRLDCKSDPDLEKLAEELKKMQANVQDITLPEEELPSQSTRENPNQGQGANEEGNDRGINDDFGFGIGTGFEDQEKLVNDEPSITPPMEHGRKETPGIPNDRSISEPPNGEIIEQGSELPGPNDPIPVSPIKETPSVTVETPAEIMETEPPMGASEVPEEPPPFVTPGRHDTDPEATDAGGSPIQLADLEDEMPELEHRRRRRRRQPTTDFQVTITRFDIGETVRNFSWNSEDEKNRLKVEQRTRIDFRVNHRRQGWLIKNLYSEFPMGHHLGKTLCKFLKHRPVPNAPLPQHSPASQSQEFNIPNMFDPLPVENQPIVEGNVDPPDVNPEVTNEPAIPNDVEFPPDPPIDTTVTAIHPPGATFDTPGQNQPIGEPRTDPMITSYIQKLGSSDLESILSGASGPFDLGALFPPNTTSKLRILCVFEKLLQLQLDGNLEMKQEESYFPITIIKY